jgi:zinc transporter 2
MVLHQHDHGHGHGHSHGHSHEHRQIQDDDDDDDDEYHEVHWWQIWKKKKRPAGKLDMVVEDQSEKKKKHRKKHKNINVRAAFIHVIGDLIQSIGVVIAGYIIKFFPEWHIVDPICTFLFSILVIISTLNVLRDAMLVLMEGAPRNIDTEEVEDYLKKLPNVRHAHSIHIWSLTMSKTALAAHLAVGNLSNKYFNVMN